MTVLVVAIADVLGAHEELDLIDLVLRQVSFLLKLTDLLHALLLVRSDFQLIFVAPQNTRGSFDSCFSHKHV